MNNIQISREQPDKVTVALTTSASTTPEIDYRHVAGGEIYVPTGSTITSLTFHVAPNLGGTYLPLQNSPTVTSPVTAPVAVVMTVAAAKAYPFPAECFGAVGVKMVGDAAGSVDISLKG